MKEPNLTDEDWKDLGALLFLTAVCLFCVMPFVLVALLFGWQWSLLAVVLVYGSWWASEDE